MKKIKINLFWLNFGMFFVAIDRSALFLNKSFGLKLTCMKKGVCKSGFPVSKLKSYVMKFEEKKIKALFYDYSKETGVKLVVEVTSDKELDFKIEKNCEVCDSKSKFKSVDVEEVFREVELGNASL